MASSTFSPDGKWMWDGTQWIPAPPPTPQLIPFQKPVPQVPKQDAMDSNFHHTNPASTSNTDFIHSKTNYSHKLIAALAASIFILAGASYLIIYNDEKSISCARGVILAEYDNPLGGVIDSTTTYYYNAGLLISKEEKNWDGTIIDSTSYTYNSVGNLIGEYRYWDSEYSRITYTYDDNGNLLTEDTKDSYSWNADERNIYTYDSQNMLITWEVDVLINGFVNSKTTYEYNLYGDKKFTHTDSDMDGDFDVSITYIYGNNGNLIERRTDDDMDGSVDSITINRYDSKGNWIESKSDINNDGSYESRDTFEYDSQGRLTNSIGIIELSFYHSSFSSVYSYSGDNLATATTSFFDDNEQTSSSITTYGCIDS